MVQSRKVKQNIGITLLLMLIVGLVLTACSGQAAAQKQVNAPVQETAQVSEVATDTALPSDTFVPTETTAPTDTPVPSDTPTATITSSPTVTEVACVALLAPEENAQLSSLGNVTFNWGAHPSASYYNLQVTTPNGWVFKTDWYDTSYIQFLRAFPAGGDYSWTVAAMSDGGQALCQAEPLAFKKAEFVPTATEKADQSLRKSTQCG